MQQLIANFAAFFLFCLLRGAQKYSVRGSKSASQVRVYGKLLPLFIVCSHLLQFLFLVSSSIMAKPQKSVFNTFHFSLKRYPFMAMNEWHNLTKNIKVNGA